ncbi:hypothetical protein [Peptostreptococcus sp.]
MATLNLNTEKIDKLYIGGQLVVESGGLTSGSFIPIDKLVEKRERSLIFKNTNKTFNAEYSSFVWYKLMGEYDEKYVFSRDDSTIFVEKDSLNTEKKYLGVPAYNGFIHKANMLVGCSGGSLKLVNLDSWKFIPLDVNCKLVVRINHKSFYVVGPRLKGLTDVPNAEIVIVNSLEDKSKNVVIKTPETIFKQGVEVVFINDKFLYYTKDDKCLYTYDLKNHTDNKIHTGLSSKYIQVNYQTGKVLFESNSNIYEIMDSTVVVANKLVDNQVYLHTLRRKYDHFLALTQDGKLIILDEQLDVVATKDLDLNGAFLLDVSDNNIFIQVGRASGSQKMVYDFDFSEKITGYTVK